MSKRVVITGMGAISTLGRTQGEIMAALKAKVNLTRHIEEWEDVKNLHTKLAAPLDGYTAPTHFSRKTLRSMSKVSILAVDSAIDAVRDAGLEGDAVLTNGRTGVAYGSCVGSLTAFKECMSILTEHIMRDINSSTYIRMMGHTTVVNLSLYFHTTGRLVNSSTACTSSSLAVGEAYELIAAGKQDVMIAGGAESLNLFHVAVFDTLFATSTRNGDPKHTPTPFNEQRDGLVLGEGACTLILEELEHAQARGAKIYAEVVGFGTNTDGVHATNPNPATQAIAMRAALEDAGISQEQIGYVSAHGTGTRNGDKAEMQAVRECFGRPVPLSTLKSYTGHTLGACGALETMVCILMMQEGWFHPTLNLCQVDPDCEGPDHITGEGRYLDVEYVMNNNFAFGGINTSLVLRRWPAPTH